MSNTDVKASTYQAWDMCAPPANATGFWDPGYQYDVLLTGLLPNRRYYYSFGSGEVKIPIMVHSTTYSLVLFLYLSRAKGIVVSSVW